MKPDRLVDGIHRVYARVGNRDLFEGIWPLTYGVMLNAYLVEGREKIALIDAVKDWEGALEEVKRQIGELGHSVGDIDYLVLNHMEPDHTGAIAALQRENPRIKIICSKKAVPLVKAFYGIEENVIAVSSGDTLELGEKKLAFIDTPNIHWPETMMTYEVHSGILFSCDAFGSFGQYDHCFDDELTQKEWDILIPETKRYYANIVSTFSKFVLEGIKKAEQVKVRMVAPSHGVVWRKEPWRAIEYYRHYAQCMDGPADKDITFIWSSMYGNTAALVDVIRNAIEEEHVAVHMHEVPQEHASFVLSSAWSSSGLVIGMPTYEYRMFPPMYHTLDILERSHLNNRKVMRFGSYGWSGGAQKQFEPFIKTLGWDLVGVVEYQGYPTQKDVERAVSAAKDLSRAVLRWCETPKDPV